MMDELLTKEDIELLKNCKICPRKCGINRFESLGFCGADSFIDVSSINLHYGEEPPISGRSGSGTIFLTHCNMKCVYCQNYPISQLGVGKRVTISEIIKSMFDLQKRGVNNINFVTPSHYIVNIRRAILSARERDLRVPVVYNTSGYDSIEGLKLIQGIVDIYMPDLRYFDSKYSKKFSMAWDYPEVARRAVKFMHLDAGDLIMNEKGIAIKGLLIRLLVLPENISGTEKTLRWIAQNLGTNTYLSIMSQYFPAHNYRNFPPLDRRITKKEYQCVLDVVDELGFSRGYIQPMI